MSAAQFVPFTTTFVTPTSVPSSTIQDVTNIWLQRGKIAYQSGNCLNTAATLLNDIKGTDMLRAQLTLPF